MLKKLQQVTIKTAISRGLIGEEVPYSSIEELVRDPETFAQRISPCKKEVQDGVGLSARTVELGEGHFVNKFDLSFSGDDPTLGLTVLTVNKPLYPHRLFSRRVALVLNPVACINGGFFFLQDELLEEHPREVIYNLDVRNGVVIGLPAASRPALCTGLDGRIFAKDLQSTGIISVGNIKLNWTGGEAVAHKKRNFVIPLSGSAILFNSACCSIIYDDPAQKTSLRRLRRDLNITPTDPAVADIVVRVTDKGESFVHAINFGGGTDFFTGNYILQVAVCDAEKIEIGASVVAHTVDSLELSGVKSAITTGPMVRHFLEHDEHEINSDLSLGSFPPFAPGVRYARSVMYEDAKGYIHMVVFDAVPRSRFMKGVSPREVAENLPSDMKWSVFLDGGQSSRITFQSSVGQVDARGNQQYVRLHKRDKVAKGSDVDSSYLWSARGRPLTNMVVITRHS